MLGGIGEEASTSKPSDWEHPTRLAPEHTRAADPSENDQVSGSLNHRVQRTTVSMVWSLRQIQYDKQQLQVPRKLRYGLLLSEPTISSWISLLLPKDPQSAEH